MLETNVLESGTLFVEKDFLTREFLSAIREEIDGAKQYNGPMLDIENRIESPEKKAGRPNIVLDLPPHSLNELKQKALQLKPRLEEFFSAELTKIKEPHFVVYNTGDFLGSHIDIKMDQNADSESYGISTVVFLNDRDEDSSDDGFSGGDLTLYGLIKNKAFSEFGYPVKAEAGKIVAFSASCLHEVTPVARGTRYVINGGFY